MSVKIKMTIQIRDLVPLKFATMFYYTQLRLIVTVPAEIRLADLENLKDLFNYLHKREPLTITEPTKSITVSIPVNQLGTLRRCIIEYTPNGTRLAALEQTTFREFTSKAYNLCQTICALQFKTTTP